MPIHLYRYGSCRDLPGLSIGVARQAPRGVRVEDRFEKGYFQIWMPLLAPSRELVAAYRKSEISPLVFARRYRKEMKAAGPNSAIALLAAVSPTLRINLGCYCQDESKCHRSELAKLIDAAAATIPQTGEPRPQFSSPACSMPEIED